MLHDKLKANRELFNITQKQMAEVLNIERSTYTYYELGRSVPTLDTLVKIARIFNTSVDELLDHTVYTSTDTLHNNFPNYKRSYENTHFGALSTSEQNLLLKLRSLTVTAQKDVIVKVHDMIDRMKSDSI